MRLFWSIGSQPARAVKTLVDIGHIPLTLTNVAVLKQQHRTPEFLNMYPPGRIPVLVDEELVLGQSGAILSYLCQKFPHISHFQGTTLEERAIVNQWVGWYQSTFRQALFRPFRRYLAYAYSGTPLFKEQSDLLLSRMEQVIDKFQELMATKKEKFVAGDKVTYADFLFYYELTNLKYFSMELNHSWIGDWRSRVGSIREVTGIDHEWQKVALQRAQAFSKLQLLVK